MPETNLPPSPPPPRTLLLEPYATLSASLMYRSRHDTHKTHVGCALVPRPASRIVLRHQPANNHSARLCLVTAGSRALAHPRSNAPLTSFFAVCWPCWITMMLVSFRPVPSFSFFDLGRGVAHVLGPQPVVVIEPLLMLSAAQYGR